MPTKTIKRSKTPVPTQVKRPTTCLCIPSGRINDVASGQCNGVVFEGLMDYRVGDKLYLVCPAVEWSSQAVEIEEVTITTTGSITQKECRRHSFVDRRHIEAVLLEAYPKRRKKDPVTFIKWKTTEWACRMAEWRKF